MDIEYPVASPRSIGSFKLKAFPDAEPGFKLETVLATVFYPCLVPKVGGKRVVWFPKLSQTVNGFLKMARRTGWLYKTLAYPIAAAAIWGTTFPAYSEATLKPPEGATATEDGSNERQHETRWPVVIFSHGVGCSRLMYSSFCGEIASRGYVVVAVEHRDGSGPSSSIKLASGETRNVDFLGWQDVTWPELPADSQPDNDTTLRKDQLAMRLAEMEEITRVMRAITQGGCIGETSVRAPDFDWSRWRNALNVDRPIASGHSLGGSAVLLAAADQARFDFRCLLAFDPAIQRLEPWTGSIRTPLLCVNSSEYTLSADFRRLQALARTAEDPPIYSVSGSTHPSFSDVFLIVPAFINRRTGLKVPANEMLDTIVDLTIAFLQGPEFTSEARLLSALAKEHAQSQLNLHTSVQGGGLDQGSPSRQRSPTTADISPVSPAAKDTASRSRFESSLSDANTTPRRPPHGQKRAQSYLKPMGGSLPNGGSPYGNQAFASTGPLHAQLYAMRLGATSTATLTGGRLGTLGSINEVRVSEVEQKGALGLPGTINWHPVEADAGGGEWSSRGLSAGEGLFDVVGTPIDEERERVSASRRDEQRQNMDDLMSDATDD